MIVPRTRLLVTYALLVLPLAGVAGIRPATMPLCAAAIAFFTALAAWDAWNGRRVLADLALTLPPTVRLQKDCDGSFEVRIQNRSAQARTIRIGLPFPREISTPSEEVVAELAAGVEWSSLAWPCHPNRRGPYFLTQAALEQDSQFGFWSHREFRPVQCELRVYPNFMNERKHVSALFLKRNHLGIHAQRQVGKGRDFEKLREYVPGDSYDEIHWKASAKRGRPVTKVFQVERTQEVYVVLDASRLMARDPALFERHITAGLLLGIAAEQQGDSFGALAFSDRILHFARARAGRGQFDVCRDMLYGLQPQGVTPAFDELATFLRTRLRKRALLIILTSLDDPAIAESFLHAIDLISRRHLVLVNMLRPALAQPIFSTGAVGTTEEVYTQLGGHLMWHDLREMGKVLQRRGVGFAMLESENLSARLVSQYVTTKARQLL